MTAFAHTVRQIVIPASLLMFTPGMLAAQELEASGRIYSAPALALLPVQAQVKDKGVSSTDNDKPSTVKSARPIAPPKKEAVDGEGSADVKPSPKLPSLKALNEISLDIRSEETPEDSYDLRTDVHCGFEVCASLKPFCWVAPGTVHNPLYFEDVALERYGQGCNPCLQPAVSGARFFADTLLLPYQMGLDCPCELEYALGFKRPGNCAPSVEKRLPWSWKGAVMEAGAVTGGLFMFPL